jgi:hypothetical protein
VRHARPQRLQPGQPGGAAGPVRLQPGQPGEPGADGVRWRSGQPGHHRLRHVQPAHPSLFQVRTRKKPVLKTDVFQLHFKILYFWPLVYDHFFVYLTPYQACSGLVPVQASRYNNTLKREASKRAERRSASPRLRQIWNHLLKGQHEPLLRCQ